MDRIADRSSNMLFGWRSGLHWCMQARCDWKDDTNGEWEELLLLHFLHSRLTQGMLIVSSNIHVLLWSFVTHCVDTSPQLKAEALNIMSLPLSHLAVHIWLLCTPIQSNNPTGICTWNSKKGPVLCFFPQLNQSSVVTKSIQKLLFEEHAREDWLNGRSRWAHSSYKGTSSSSSSSSYRSVERRLMSLRMSEMSSATGLVSSISSKSVSVA